MRQTGRALLLALAWLSTFAAAPPASPPPARFQHPLRTSAPRAHRAAGAAATTAPGEVGYIPCDVAHAYGLYPNGLNGAGTTIAIVVAGDEPNLGSDLHAFSATFGLADPPRLSVQAPFGHTANIGPGWPQEIAVDAEWAHAAAPGAAIDVVEAATDQTVQNPPQSDLLATTLWAVQHLGPDVVVMPWGASEATYASKYGAPFEAQFNTQFFPASNGAGRPVAYLAPAQQESTFTAAWPAAATTVAGVGGTSLGPQAFGYAGVPGSHYDCSAASGSFGVNQTNETVWPGTGGGASMFEAKPSWQSGFGPSGNRLTPDVAMLADPTTGVASYQNGSWSQQLVGGLGLATALWAGVVATVDQERRLIGQPGLSVSDSASWVYTANAASYNDVVTGSAPPAAGDPCVSSGACAAGPGFDQVSGRGSPLAPALVADLGGSAPPPPGSPNAPNAIADASGHGYVGSWTGGVTFGSPGLVSGSGGAATTFDGSSGQVDTTYTQPAVSAYSVEAWIQTTDGGVNRAIVQDRGSGSGVSLTLGLDFSATNTPGAPFFIVDSDNLGIGVWSSHAINDGRPHHLVGTWSGTPGSAVAPAQFALYVDGAPATTTAVSAGTATATAPVRGLGGTKIARSDAWNTYLSGTVDEVATYTYALSASRVQAHSTAALGYSAAVLADAPAAYYRLDDRSGSIVDSSGHGNGAAWSGGVTFGAPAIVQGGAASIYLDGTGFVQAPVLAPLQGDSPRSIEVRFGAVSGDQQPILDAGCTGATARSFTLGLTQSGGVGGSPPVNTPGVYLTLFGAGDVYLPGQNLVNNGAHQLVVTLSGSTVTIYVDGATPNGLVWNGSAWSASQAQPFTLPVTPDTAASALWIGRSRCAIWNVGSGDFHGLLEDVSVYDHVLTSPRVGAHLKGGRADVLADSPVAYYRLDDRSLSIADSSGHQSWATWNGGVGFGAPGLVGDGDTAMSFDGSSGFIREGPALAALAGTSSRSVEVWLSTTTGAQQAILSAACTAATGRSFTLNLTQSGGVGFSPPVNTPGVYLTLWSDDVYLPDQNLADGRPHQLVVTMSGSTVSIYVDGATPNGLISNGSTWTGPQAQPFTLPTAPDTLGSPFWIGRAPCVPFGVGSGFFQGSLDEVSVYDQALTSARVQAHLTAGSGYRAAVLADSPVAYYRLDERSATVADASGNGSAAAWNGGVEFGSPGLVSGDADAAMSFDGVTGLVELPRGPFGSYPTSGSTTGYTLTFEAWFTTTAGGVILGQTSGAAPPAAPISWVPALYVDTAGALRESLFWEQTNQNVAPGPYNDGRPHHVVAVYASGTDTLYVDGQAVASMAQPEIGYAASYRYLLGTGFTSGWPSTNGSWYPFGGALDEVAIYPSQLTPSQIQAHFTAGSGYRSAVLADSPAAYYRLDDGGVQ